MEAARGHEVVPLPRAEADLADADALCRAVARAAPDAVVHAGAMTNVDACEREPEAARAVNALATGVLAEAAAKAGAALAYVSTDYVFDGERGGYRETDPANPLSVYGRTKLEGERLALAAHPDAIVARTSVVFAPLRRNFVTWAIGEMRAGRPVRLAEDQRVSPTYAPDLAETILALLSRGERGVWHAAGASALTRVEMGRAVARTFSLDAGLVQPARFADLRLPAPRPRDSTLDVAKVSRLRKPMTFDEALARLKERMP
ncbi:MAG TPA: dTDP-4-dehydrorhamnose reductase [Candidatus Thermoplasmatota archaeon]|nr:dTDP-4-dehydrorhamnose reductase [Candidatus Thermoplasmatota archaeon]